jgi:alpha-tubulin suppressor-like RCC1 family protein
MRRLLVCAASTILFVQLAACDSGESPGDSDLPDVIEDDGLDSEEDIDSADGDDGQDGEVIPDGCEPECGTNASCDELAPGEFACSCDDGYAENEFGECKNVDECDQTPDPCEEGVECNDTIGSYECECPEGTEDVDGECIAPPSEKPDVTVSDGTRVDSILVEWTEVEGAESYNVLRNGTVIANVSALSYVDDEAPLGDLTPGDISATEQTLNAGVQVTITGASYSSGDLQAYLIEPLNAAGEGPSSDVAEGRTGGDELACQWERRVGGPSADFETIDGSTTSFELLDDSITAADGEVAYRCQFELDGVNVGESDVATGRRGTCDDGVLADEEEFVDCGSSCPFACSAPVLTSGAGPLDVIRAEAFVYDITVDARPALDSVEIISKPDWIFEEDTDNDGITDRLVGTPYSGDRGAASVSLNLVNPVGNTEADVELSVRDRRIVKLYGGDVMCADIEGGTTKCWGDNSYGQLGYGNADPLSWDGTAHHYGPLALEEDVLELLPADGWSCYRETGGDVSCVGGDIAIRNFLTSFPSLALSPVSLLASAEGGRLQPLPVDLPSPAIELFDGKVASCATLQNGNAACWSWRLNTQGTEIVPIDDDISASTGAERIEVITSFFGLANCWLTSADKVECDLSGGGSGGSIQQLPTIPGGAEVEQLEIIVAGESFEPAVIVRAGGSAYAWSEGSASWTDLGFSGTVAEIATGIGHVCARNMGGNVACLGDNSTYQISEAASSSFNVPTNASLTGDATDLAAGYGNTCALVEMNDQSQSVECWGSGGVSRLEYQGVLLSSLLAALFGVEVEISHPALNLIGTGGQGSINPTTAFVEALRSQGSENPLTVPVVEGPPRFTSRPSQTAIVGESWTYDITFEDGDGDPVELEVLELPEGADLAENPPADADARIEWTPSPSQEGGGEDNELHLRLSDGSSTVDQALTVQVRASSRVASVDVGVRHACAVVRFVNETVPTRVYCWGAGPLGVSSTFIGDDETPSGNSIDFSGNFKALQVAVGAEHSCAVGEYQLAQQVICWGNNDFGQLGVPSSSVTGISIPDITRSNRLVEFPQGIDIDTLYAGGNHTCALTTDGDLYCWGDNQFGQLGIGDFSDVSDESPSDIGPVDWSSVGGLNGDILDVGVGAEHTCALVEESGERNIYCWGRGIDARTGLGTSDDIASPDLMVYSNTEDWEAVTSGLRNSCALDDNGSLICWGEGSYGLVGDGRPNSQGINSAVGPADVDLTAQAWTGANAISVGADHACAILQDRHRIQCWGYDRLSSPEGDPPTDPELQIGGGKLGLGRIAGFVGEDEVPAEVGFAEFDNELSGVFAGTNVTCATFTNGDLICWGVDQFGGTGSGERRVYGDNEPLGLVPPVEFD